MTDIERTLSHVRAAVQRAEFGGARSISLSIQDLKELLPYMEAGIYTKQVEKRMKPAGWVDPEALQGQRSGQGRSIRLHRCKSLRHNTEVYFCDVLREKVGERAMTPEVTPSSQAPQALAAKN